MKTYDPKAVTITVGGFIMSGFAEDRMVNVARMNDTWTLKTGTDGEGTRSKSNDKSGEVTISLMETSESNAVLTAFAKADEYTNNGTFPLLVRDNNAESYYVATRAWVVKPPEADKGREAGVREWKIQTDHLEWVEFGTEDIGLG
ncbi:hypothetical protein D3C72_718190 [compost metagenome]